MMPQGDGFSRPPRHAWKRNPLFRFLASLRLAVVLLGVLIVMSIIGTIAESKFDADTARIWIYEAPWFHLWLLLLTANLVCSTLTRWPWKKHHTGFLLTHLGIILLLAGAVAGQIWGVEGTMSLTKGAGADNILVLQKRQMTIRDPDSKQAVMIRLGRRPLTVRGGQPVELWTTPGGWKLEAVDSSNRLLSTFQPRSAPAGAPAALVRLQSKSTRQDISQWLLSGDRDHARLDLGLITVDLAAEGSPAPSTGAPNRAIITALADGTFRLALYSAGHLVTEVPLAPGQALNTGWNDWTIQAGEPLPSAGPAFHFEPVPDGQETRAGEQLTEGVLVRATRGDQTLDQWVGTGWRVSIPTGAFPLEISYGWEVFHLPFGLVLEDFVVERNEGTDDPASFRSDLAMVLPDGRVAARGSCSMNQPANYPQAFWRSLTGLTYKISQASWNPNDLNHSAVQILRDPGWLGKWTGSLIICAGLVTMFTFRKPGASKPGVPGKRAQQPEPTLAQTS